MMKSIGPTTSGAATVEAKMRSSRAGRTSHLANGRSKQLGTYVDCSTAM